MHWLNVSELFCIGLSPNCLHLKCYKNPQNKETPLSLKPPLCAQMNAALYSTWDSRDARVLWNPASLVHLVYHEIENTGKSRECGRDTWLSYSNVYQSLLVERSGTVANTTKHSYKVYSKKHSRECMQYRIWIFNNWFAVLKLKGRYNPRNDGREKSDSSWQVVEALGFTCNTLWGTLIAPLIRSSCTDHFQQVTLTAVYGPFYHQRCWKTFYKQPQGWCTCAFVHIRIAFLPLQVWITNVSWMVILKYLCCIQGSVNLSRHLPDYHCARNRLFESWPIHQEPAKLWAVYGQDECTKLINQFGCNQPDVLTIIASSC